MALSVVVICSTDLKTKNVKMVYQSKCVFYRTFNRIRSFHQALERFWLLYAVFYILF